MMLKKTFSVIFILCLAISAFSAEVNDETVIAKIKDEVLTIGEMNQLLSQSNMFNTGQKHTFEDKLKVIDNFIDYSVFYLAGVDAGYNKDEEIINKLASTKFNAISSEYRKQYVDMEVEITDNEIEKYYNENKEDFKEKEKANVDILLFTSEEEANKVFDEMKTNDDFKYFVNEYIGNKTIQKKEGNFEVKKDKYIPAVGKDPQIFELLFSCELGKINPPLKIEKGYIISRVNSRQEASYRSLDDVKKTITAKLKPAKKQELIAKAVNELKEKYNVVIYNDVISKIDIKELEDQPTGTVLADIDGNNFTVKDLIDFKMNSRIPAAVGQGNDILALIDLYLEPELFYKEGLAIGIEEDENVKKSIGRLEKTEVARKAYQTKVVNAVTLSDEYLLEYYNDNKETYKKKDMVKLSHILINNEEQANNVFDRLKNGEDFETLAIEFSEDKYTADKGGNIGTAFKETNNIPKMGQNAELFAALYALNVNDYYLYKHTDGFHIYKITEKVDNQYEDFESVKGRIEQQQKRALMKDKFTEVKTELREKYSYEIYDELIMPTIEEMFEEAQDAQQRQKFSSAVTIYDQIIEKAEKLEYKEKASFLKAYIYSEEMKDTEKAKEAYKAFLDEFPESDFADDAKYMLEELEKE